MDAYEALYPDAAQSWRLWQGTLSGKAGVTFDAQNCGEAMGEKGCEVPSTRAHIDPHWRSDGDCFRETHPPTRPCAKPTHPPPPCSFFLSSCFSPVK